jgi:hypothetical protein
MDKPAIPPLAKLRAFAIKCEARANNLRIYVDTSGNNKRQACVDDFTAMAKYFRALAGERSLFTGQ